MLQNIPYIRFYLSYANIIIYLDMVKYHFNYMHILLTFVCLTILYFTFNKESYLSTKVYIYTPMREEKRRQEVIVK
jgi:hypothetical protein